MGRIWQCHFGPVRGFVNSQSHVVPFGIAPTCSFLDGGAGPVWDGWEASDAREFYANRWSVGPIRLGIGLRCPIFGLPIWVCTVTAVPAYACLAGPPGPLSSATSSMCPRSAGSGYGGALLDGSSGLFYTISHYALSYSAITYHRVSPLRKTHTLLSSYNF